MFICRRLNMKIYTQKLQYSSKIKQLNLRKEKASKQKLCWTFPRNSNLILEEKLWVTSKWRFSWKAPHQCCRKVSYLIYKINPINLFSSDPVLADLTLGPTENGRQGQHWRKMMDQPGERIFMWHMLECMEKRIKQDWRRHRQDCD